MKHPKSARRCRYYSLVMSKDVQGSARHCKPVEGRGVGPPALPFNSANRSQAEEAAEDSANNMRAQLAALHPPRKFYQHYYASREANDNLHHPPQGLHDFLWGYFHLKSADWNGNKPIPLKNASAAELAQIPGYYIMDQSKGMAETVA